MYGTEDAMRVTEACEWSFLIGTLIGAFVASICVAIAVGIYFQRREQAVYEAGHVAGWDSRSRHVQGGIR